MRELDLRGWIKNPGTKNVPKGWDLGDTVDVIHRDGFVYFDRKIGQGTATTFKGSTYRSSSDIMYFRMGGSESATWTVGPDVGNRIMAALAMKEVKIPVENNEVSYTELHVDSRTFNGLIEAISRDKPNMWSFNSGGVGPYPTLTIGTTKFIKLTEVK